jgi:hypothetical protein
MDDDFVEPGSGTADTETKPQTFGQAFKAARAAGDKTFTWQGKKYTTEMSGGAKPAAKAAAPAPAPAPQRVEVVGKRAKAEPAKESSGLPTAAERFSEIRKKLSDAEAENVRKRNERAEASKKSMSDFMTGVKRRLGTQAMREEAGFAKGGTVRGGGCEQRGKTKGRFV